RSSVLDAHTLLVRLQFSLVIIFPAPLFLRLSASLIFLVFLLLSFRFSLLLLLVLLRGVLVGSDNFLQLAARKCAAEQTFFGYFRDRIEDHVLKATLCVKPNIFSNHKGTQSFFNCLRTSMVVLEPRR